MKFENKINYEYIYIFKKLKLISKNFKLHKIFFQLYFIYFRHSIYQSTYLYFHNTGVKSSSL
jgi:hypothetical protein